MSCTVDRKALVTALRALRKVVPAKPFTPILATVRLEAGGGTLHLLGTDMDRSLSLSLPAEGACGPTCVSAEAMSRLAQTGTGLTLALEERPTGLLARHATGRAVLPTMDAREFPAATPQPGKATVTLDGGNLATVIGRVRPAVGMEETRHYLCGTCLEMAGGRLALTATDGHRLAHGGCDAESDGAIGGLIVPTAALTILAGLDGPVTLRLSAQSITAEWEGGTFASWLIDGTYPDWRRVIPPEPPHRAELVAAELARAAAQVEWASGDKARIARLRLGPDGGSLRIADKDRPEVEAEFSCAAPEAFETGLNARYLADLCASVGSERVVMGWTNPQSALRIFVPDRPDDIFILMPARF